MLDINIVILTYSKPYCTILAEHLYDFTIEKHHPCFNVVKRQFIAVNVWLYLSIKISYLAMVLIDIKINQSI